MTATGPLKFHGGKQYLASRIVALMPPHTHYCEPFFGGGAVLLAKDPEGVSECANDINRDLMNFWRVLQHPGLFHEFQRCVEATPFSESEWGRATEGLGIYTHEVGRAWAFFVACRQSLAGRMKNFAPLSRTRTRRGMNEQCSAWLNAIDGLAAVHGRLKRVAILSHDALDVIRQQDGPATLFYCDPPYPHETRATKDDYAHEMTATNHMRLCGLLADIKGKFLLSGYMNASYHAAERSYGWKRRDFDLPNNAAGGAEKRRMTESLWANYELPK